MKNKKFKSTLYSAGIYLIAILCFLLLLVSLLSLLHDVPFWLIKILDFPRPQYFIAGVVLLVSFVLLNKKWNSLSALLIAGVLTSLLIHGTLLLPYIAGEKTVPNADSGGLLEENKLGILLANVLIDNKEAPELLKIIDEANPDLILAMEVDEWWVSQLQELQKNYPYFIEYPLDNSYGMALYSKFEFK